MTYPELFDMSAAQYPNGGATLSPAACGFIEPELATLVKRYRDEIADPTMSEALRQMCERHLAGLEAIHAAVKTGMTRV